MKETYKELKARHQENLNAFPIGAAFTNDQFDKMMREWGLTSDDTDKICSIGAGCFIRKTDKQAFHEMVETQHKELSKAMKDIEFFESAALYEMFNHEYGINYQADWDVINALGYEVEYIDGTWIEQLEKCAELTEEQKKAYRRARAKYYRKAEENEWI